MGSYVCGRPVHPGEMLKEEIEYRGLSQTEVAERMKISYKILNDILNCRRVVTAPVAILFEAVLGIDADMIMRMQLDCNMQKARQDKLLNKRVKSIVPIYSSAAPHC